MTEENYTPEEKNENEENKNDEERKNQINWTPGLVTIVVFLIALLIAFVVKSVSFEPLKKKTKKGEFRAQYNVDRDTFNNWIKYLCKDVFPDYDAYLKIRKFTYVETVAMTAILGLGEGFSDLRSKNKKEIVEECESNYRSLRESVQKFPDKFGISYEAYSSMSVFPPRIAEAIISQFKG